MRLVSKNPGHNHRTTSLCHSNHERRTLYIYNIYSSFMFIHPELPRIRFLRFWFTCVEYLPAICGVFPCRLGSLWSSGQQSHVSFEAVDFGVAHSVNFTVALRSPIIKLFGAQTLLATQAGIRSELAVVRESSETWPPFMATETNRMPSLVYASWILLYT